LFSRSSVELVRDADFRREDLVRYAHMKSSRPDPRSFLNGYSVEFTLRGAQTGMTFVNQGFAVAGEDANRNHSELLDYLAAKSDERVRLTLALDYWFWALESARIVAIDDFRFHGFYYAPQVSAGAATKIAEWLPDAPTMRAP
jgi:hypothetical protein